MDKGENKIAISTPCYPMIVNCYKKGDDELCRWNYLVLGDIVHGAATLCEKEVLLKYFKQIVGRVIFAEDNVYRLMMYDDIVPVYYEKEVLIYEYGFGVSTSGEEKWKKD